MPEALSEVIISGDDVVDLVNETDDHESARGDGSGIREGEGGDVSNGGHIDYDDSGNRDTYEGGIKDPYVADDPVFYWKK